MKLTGGQCSVDDSQVSEYNVSEAIISDDNKEIFIDYEAQNRKSYVKLKSENGIDFHGEYGAVNKIGDCSFTLYKNEKEFLLLGGYSSAEDGQGSWWIKLEPTKSN